MTIFGWYHLMLVAGVVALWVILCPHVNEEPEPLPRRMSDYGEIEIWRKP